jgi:hypothetical protein
MACIAYRDQELEESFSFSSCYDFNSSSFQSIFSDESDDESYIEIALEQKNYHGDIDDWADEEMELRISFSSIVPFQEPSTTTTSIENESAATMSKSPSASSTTTTFTMNSSSPSKEGDQWDTQMGSKASNSNCRIQKTIKRKAQFPKVHGFLNMLKPSLTVSSEASDENGRPASSNHLELVRPRYPSIFSDYHFSIFLWHFFQKWPCSLSVLMFIKNTLDFGRKKGPWSQFYADGP